MRSSECGLGARAAPAVPRRQCVRGRLHGLYRGARTDVDGVQVQQAKRNMDLLSDGIQLASSLASLRLMHSSLHLPVTTMVPVLYFGVTNPVLALLQVLHLQHHILCCDAVLHRRGIRLARHSFSLSRTWLHLPCKSLRGAQSKIWPCRVWMDFVLEPDELDRMDTLTSLCVTDCNDLRLFLDTARIFACTVHPHAREPMRRGWQVQLG